MTDEFMPHQPNKDEKRKRGNLISPTDMMIFKDSKHRTCGGKKHVIKS